jgi:hypothetical protein
VLQALGLGFTDSARGALQADDSAKAHQVARKGPRDVHVLFKVLCSTTLIVVAGSGSRHE